MSASACGEEPDAAACSPSPSTTLKGEVCWVCLQEGDAGRPLTRPCHCPRFCHAGCVARWQLQSAGTRRETQCDFCEATLPDWKDVLTPPEGCSAPAIMNVNFHDHVYGFVVKPGPEGYLEFTHAIRTAFHLPEWSELNITFTCDEPSSGSLLTLQGRGAYNAAVHCAAISATRRHLQQGSNFGSSVVSAGTISPSRSGPSHTSSSGRSSSGSGGDSSQRPGSPSPAHGSGAAGRGSGASLPRGGGSEQPTPAMGKGETGLWLWGRRLRGAFTSMFSPPLAAGHQTE